MYPGWASTVTVTDWTTQTQGSWLSPCLSQLYSDTILFLVRNSERGLECYIKDSGLQDSQ